MLTREQLFDALYGEYEEINNKKGNKSNKKVVAVGVLLHDLDEMAVDIHVDSVLDSDFKTFFTFSQVAGLFGVKPDHFLGIIDDNALIILSKYRSRIFFCLDEKQINSVIISGITKKEINAIVKFFQTNINIYEKYQYYTTEIDYELEDGIVYDIAEIDYSQNIENAIFYFK